MFLIDDILLSPVKGLIWLSRKIDQTVRKEYFDEEGIKDRLMKLQVQLELGEISEEKFVAEEKVLLARLEAATEREEREG